MNEKNTDTLQQELMSTNNRSTGKRYIFRRFTGSAEVYRKLLTVDCPYLPRIEEVAERDGQVAVLEEYARLMIRLASKSISTA